MSGTAQHARRPAKIIRTTADPRRRSSKRSSKAATTPQTACGLSRPTPCGPQRGASRSAELSAAGAHPPLRFALKAAQTRQNSSSVWFTHEVRIQVISGRLALLHAAVCGCPLPVGELGMQIRSGLALVASIYRLWDACGGSRSPPARGCGPRSPSTKQVLCRLCNKVCSSAPPVGTMARAAQASSRTREDDR